MHYSESKIILNQFLHSSRIFIGGHRYPDPDCLGSMLALYEILTKEKKEVFMVSPTDIQFVLSSFDKISKIKTNFDYSDFHWKKDDLIIFLDCTNWNMATNQEDLALSDCNTVVIDHHQTNTSFSKINLIDTNASSTAEVIFNIFEDAGFIINTKIADYLLAGIIGDTGAFRNPSTTRYTFKVVEKLLEKGGNKDKLIREIYASFSITLLKFCGEVLRNIQYERHGNFVWSAILYKDFIKLGAPNGGREWSVGMFAQIVDKVDFGVIMVEEEKGVLTLSFRSRTGIDVSKIAKKYGGGGHIYAAGAKIRKNKMKIFQFGSWNILSSYFVENNVPLKQKTVPFHFRSLNRGFLRREINQIVNTIGKY